jgi:NADPH-dependent 2,4-dienoyl-CoA reductase/sulfur reductase-like enzyme
MAQPLEPLSSGQPIRHRVESVAAEASWPHVVVVGAGPASCELAGFPD